MDAEYSSNVLSKQPKLVFNILNIFFLNFNIGFFFTSTYEVVFFSIDRNVQVYDLSSVVCAVPFVRRILVYPQLVPPYHSQQISSDNHLMQTSYHWNLTRKTKFYYRAFTSYKYIHNIVSIFCKIQIMHNNNNYCNSIHFYTYDMPSILND